MKTYIHPRTTGALREALEDLLEEVGCEIVDDLKDCEIDLAVDEQIAESVEDELDDEGTRIPPVCVVILEPDLTEGDLEPELTAAVALGCRVVGIWGSGTNGDLSPLQDYGADTVPWDIDRVREAVRGNPQHQGPTGDKVPSPKPTTGGC